MDSNINNLIENVLSGKLLSASPDTRKIFITLKFWMDCLHDFKNTNIRNLVKTDGEIFKIFKGLIEETCDDPIANSEIQGLCKLFKNYIDGNLSVKEKEGFYLSTILNSLLSSNNNYLKNNLSIYTAKVEYSNKDPDPVSKQIKWSNKERKSRIATIDSLNRNVQSIESDTINEPIINEGIIYNFTDAWSAPHQFTDVLLKIKNSFNVNGGDGVINIVDDTGNQNKLPNSGRYSLISNLLDPASYSKIFPGNPYSFERAYFISKLEQPGYDNSKAKSELENLLNSTLIMGIKDYFNFIVLPLFNKLDIEFTGIEDSPDTIAGITFFNQNIDEIQNDLFLSIDKTKDGEIDGLFFVMQFSDGQSETFIFKYGDNSITNIDSCITIIQNVSDWRSIISQIRSISLAAHSLIQIYKKIKGTQLDNSDKPNIEAAIISLKGSGDWLQGYNNTTLQDYLNSRYKKNDITCITRTNDKFLTGDMIVSGSNGLVSGISITNYMSDIVKSTEGIDDNDSEIKYLTVLGDKLHKPITDKIVFNSILSKLLDNTVDYNDVNACFSNLIQDNELIINGKKYEFNNTSIIQDLDSDEKKINFLINSITDIKKIENLLQNNSELERIRDNITILKNSLDGNIVKLESAVDKLNSKIAVMKKPERAVENLPLIIRIIVSETELYTSLINDIEEIKNTIDTYRQNIETSLDSVNETFKVTLDMTAISELIEMNKNIIVETQTKMDRLKITKIDQNLEILKDIQEKILNELEIKKCKARRTVRSITKTVVGRTDNIIKQFDDTIEDYLSKLITLKDSISELSVGKLSDVITNNINNNPVQDIVIDEGSSSSDTNTEFDLLIKAAEIYDDIEKISRVEPNYKLYDSIDIKKQIDDKINFSKKILENRNLQALFKAISDTEAMAGGKIKIGGTTPTEQRYICRSRRNNPYIEFILINIFNKMCEKLGGQEYMTRQALKNITNENAPTLDTIINTIKEVQPEFKMYTNENPIDIINDIKKIGFLKNDGCGIKKWCCLEDSTDIECKSGEVIYLLDIEQIDTKTIIPSEQDIGDERYENYRIKFNDIEYGEGIYCSSFIMWFLIYGSKRLKTFAERMITPQQGNLFPIKEKACNYIDEIIKELKLSVITELAEREEEKIGVSKIGLFDTTASIALNNISTKYTLLQQIENIVDFEEIDDDGSIEYNELDIENITIEKIKSLFPEPEPEFKRRKSERLEQLKMQGQKGGKKRKKTRRKKQKKTKRNKKPGKKTKYRKKKHTKRQK